jgi:hypothetical protein
MPCAEPAAQRVSSADTALQSAMYFSPSSVKVKVEGDWVTLSGDVEWESTTRLPSSQRSHPRWSNQTSRRH